MKKIVICSDGTGNEYGEHNTNVVLTYHCAKKSENQIMFYDPGVGTGGWEYNEGGGVLKAKHDEATGEGLQNNVNDAYHFLMETYQPGDQVYLFGFSRGAFTVRSLAGMLYKCGLLGADNDNLVEYASKIYNTPENDRIAMLFKQTFSLQCPVHFIGVWDTVESLILHAGKKFHNASLNPDVKFGYHALAIDERRKDFPPCLWNESNPAQGQTIEQVWFAGVHSDVGGWYDERGLSHTALQWMMTKAKSCGLRLDNTRLAKFVGNPHDKIHNSYKKIWKFRGSHTRKIPDGSRIHRSVIERMEQTKNRYAPKNLPENRVIIEE